MRRAASFEGSVAGRAFGRQTGHFLFNALSNAFFVLRISEDQAGAKPGHVVWQTADAGDVSNAVAGAFDRVEIRFVVARPNGPAAHAARTPRATRTAHPSGPADVAGRNGSTRAGNRGRRIIATADGANEQDYKPLHRAQSDLTESSSQRSHRGTAKRDAKINCLTGERLATGVLAIGSPVATAPHVDTRLGADPIAVLPIASRSSM